MTIIMIMSSSLSIARGNTDDSLATLGGLAHVRGPSLGGHYECYTLLYIQ